MPPLRLAALLTALVAAACFLLTAFGIDHAGGVTLLPLGLLFFVITVILDPRLVV